MTKKEAIRWLQLDIAMMKFDPSTGEEAYLNEDAKKTLEALDMAIAALSAIDQVRWERDTAERQLEELGYSIGEKIRKQ